MHWFDITNNGARKYLLRVLAKGGLYEVLNIIGTYLGFNHIVTFNIGLLTVTKNDKG